MAKKVKKTMSVAHIYLLTTSLLLVLFFVIDLFFSAHKKIPQVYAGTDIEEHFAQQGETRVYLRIKPVKKDTKTANMTTSQNIHLPFIDWVKEIFKLM